MFSFTLAQSEKSTEESEYKLFVDATLEGLYQRCFSLASKAKSLVKA